MRAFSQLPLHGALRDPAHGGDLGEREAAEELQVDDVRELRLRGRELLERLADPDELAVSGGCRAILIVEGRDPETATALLGAAAAGVVDDQPPHHLGRIPHEPSPIGKTGPSRRAMFR